MAETPPSTEPDEQTGAGDGQQAADPLSVADRGSEMNRRHLLAVLGSAGAFTTAGCLGLLGERSETGPRPGDPTPADGSTGGQTTPTDDTAETFDVEWVNEGATIAVASDENLLQRALDEDLDPPYQCERGVCGVCTSKVDGDGTEYVDHSGAEYLSEDQIAGGYVLPCVGSPKQDFALETGVQDEADSFAEGGGEETTEAEETTAADVETFDVEWVNEGATIDVASNENLLDRALAEDLDPPYECEHGVCGVCTSKVDGDGTEYVDHSGAEYLSDDQIADGYVLPCVGSPKQDFALETGVQDEADEV